MKKEQKMKKYILPLNKKSQNKTLSRQAKEDIC